MKTWDARHTAAILKAADGDELGALWRLALMMGMRRGEMLGLMWQDIDFERGALSVRRMLSRGNGGTWELGTPKSAASRRLIALPSSVIGDLRIEEQVGLPGSSVPSCERFTEPLSTDL